MNADVEQILVERGAKPLYQALADSLVQRIRSGELQPNDRIPSENDLVRQYQMGRNTVRHAISELVSQGILKTIHGVGTFVEDTRSIQSLPC